MPREANCFRLGRPGWEFQVLFTLSTPALWSYTHHGLSSSLHWGVLSQMSQAQRRWCLLEETSGYFRLSHVPLLGSPV